MTTARSDTTHSDTAHIHELVAHIESALATIDLELGYHPTEIEAALVEAVFSARALYGSPTTGVRGVLARWRAHRGVTPLDDLAHLAAFAEDPEHLVSVFDNRQRVPGNHVTKAAAVALVARSLTELGCTHAADLVDSEDVTDYRAAFTSVPGVGSRSWENFTMHAGRVGPEAESLIVDFVSGSSKGSDPADTRSLLSAAAHRLSVAPERLGYGIWRCQRRRQLEDARAARSARTA